MDLQAVKKVLRFTLLAAAALTLLFMAYAIATGFPPEIFHRVIKIKNLKTPVLIFSLLIFGQAFLSPMGAREGVLNLANQLKRAASARVSLWILFFAASILLTWQQISEYYSAEINFLPFSIYDYMIYYLFHGVPTYSGLLHEFYHVNLILYVFAPFWKVWQSPLWLVLNYGFLAAAAIFPLYHIARRRSLSPAVAFLACFVYLNYRYLQNLMQANFSVEVFYPLFILTAVLMAMRGSWRLYYLFILLTLLIKEDASLYCGAVALLVFFMAPKGSRFLNIYHRHAAGTVFLAALYVAFMLFVFVPASGTNIFIGDTENFHAHGDTAKEVILKFLKAPGEILYVLFGSGVKLETYFKLLSRLAFLPLLSPSVLLIFFPIAPLFMHVSGANHHFVELRLYYGATVLPFVFIAFIFGLSNLLRRIPEKFRIKLLWGIAITLFLLNAGHYRTEPVTPEDRKSIEWAASLPPEANVVTHGHLLPYVGYRKFNYYLADPWELSYHDFHPFYSKADYYLLDKNVNLYPWDEARIDRKIQDLKEDPRYEIIRSDENRILFKRRSDEPGTL